MDFNFKDKVVIVTGAGSGIGAATALKFARLFAKVVIVGRNEKKLTVVETQIEKAQGIKPLVVKADLTIDADVKRIVNETVNNFGRIDVLVNNAGVGTLATLTDGIEPFDEVMATNLRSVYLLTSLVVPFLKQTKGNIVNISSVASTRPAVELLPYSISKAALDMFTKCISKTLGTDGIRVNSVNPGPVRTDFHKAGGFNEEEENAFFENRIERSPLGKIATSEEVADLIAFVASGKAGSITGSFHFIENGLLYC